MVNWDDYRYFSNLVQTGSVRATADFLRVNPSTVGRRLDSLENRLGVKLFVRGPKGLEVTRDGADLMTRLGPLASGLSDLEQEWLERGTADEGLIRVSLPDVMAVRLMPEFSGFLAKHPDLELEFLAPDREPDLSRGEADIAIRVTDQPAESLVGRLLGRYRLMPYASREYLENHDPLTDPERCRWIESSNEHLQARGFRSRYFAGMPAGSCCGSLPILQAAVAAGMGIGLLPCIVGDADARLRRVGVQGPALQREIWLLFHPDFRGVARIQSVSAHIQEAFARLEPDLLGTEGKP